LDNLKKRVLSGIIGVTLMIIIILKGEIYLDISLFIVSMIGLREIYNALTNLSINPIKWVGFLSCFFIYLSIYVQFEIYLLMLSVALILLISYVINEKIRFIDISATFFSIIYVPCMLINISFLSNTRYIWMIFTIAFGTDTFAYLVGSTIGKHKLSPKLSPKKSVEGAIGGIVGSLIVTLTYSYYFAPNPFWIIALLAIVSSVLAQIGDLAASKIKRESGIKDYGNIIPGHGGILDRFDSIIFVSPIVFYFSKFFLF
jgi:phosphatidate cytidylyltransferase